MKTQKLLVTIKVGCVALAAVILSANCIMINEAVRYAQQESFFESQSGFSYYRIISPVSSFDDHKLLTDRNNTQKLHEEINTRFGSHAIHLYDMTDTFGFNTVLVNRSGLDSLMSYFSQDLKNTIMSSTEETVYVFFPQGTDQTILSNIKKGVESVCFYNSNTKETHIEFLSYSGRSYAVAVNRVQNPYRSQLLSNPVIIFDNIQEPWIMRYPNPAALAQNFLYSIPAEELFVLQNKYHLSSENLVVTNAGNLYTYYHTGIMKNCRILSWISLLILLLEGSIIVLSVRLEYTMRGKELIVKRTLGYNILQQNRSLILSSMLSVALSTILSVILILIINYGDPRYGVPCGVFLMGFEFVTIIANCVRMNRISTVSILKGARI